ncbi:YbaN family protein [Jannaschia rubra]|uniref:Inner membrane protein YbaN n=1 Tax=Jannaschia rubra TaxID=282197 RepID=A0A0M6XUE6_9RHOB|nr:YbaN family protein [Jannaschia rubra]CTQ34769.1 Inner membrane protein YbaN [Jannaschia rubra]SFG70177.1 hypothetical protein SAMN04488517_11172 [Jannaschia rubra]
MSSRPDLTPRRLFWLVVGGLALALGLIGALLPVMPTAPFVIVAAFAFARSSPQMAHWLETHRTFGPVIINWRDHGGIAPRYKALSVGMMAVSMTLALFLALPPVVLAVQGTCLAAASLFILTRPNGPH